VNIFFVLLQEELARAMRHSRITTTDEGELCMPSYDRSAKPSDINSSSMNSNGQNHNSNAVSPLSTVTVPSVPDRSTKPHGSLYSHVRIYLMIIYGLT